MKRLTVNLIVTAIAAAGLLAADATIAGPRIDPSRVKPQQELQVKPELRPGLVVAQCATHFQKVGTPGEQSYRCVFAFKPKCKAGMVPARPVLQQVAGGYRVVYPCYEPPH